jgi:transposase
MRTFVFTPQDLEVIGHERFHHPHPRVQQKMEVLWLKSKALAHTEIARLTNLGRRTVQRYLTDYLEGGLSALRQLHWKGPASALAGHTASLEDYFLEHPPRSTAEAQAAIERLTGVRRGLTQVRAFLKKNWGWLGARSVRSRPRPTSRNKPGS